MTTLLWKRKDEHPVAFGRHHSLLCWCLHLSLFLRYKKSPSTALLLSNWHTRKKRRYIYSAAYTIVRVCAAFTLIKLDVNRVCMVVNPLLAWSAEEGKYPRPYSWVRIWSSSYRFSSFIILHTTHRLNLMALNFGMISLFLFPLRLPLEPSCAVGLVPC